MKIALTIAACIAAGLIGSMATDRVSAQSTPNNWQMIAGSGGDGASAWKFNPTTGESFFCFRQNCFPSKLQP